MYGRQELRKRGFCESRISRAVLLLECALEEFPLYYFVTLFRKLREKNKRDFGYRFNLFDTRAFFQIPSELIK